MELVYLWVEEYKNIKNQGFNFSPKFTCKYDEKNQELTIDENKDALENFFGENINVTAIVGENGSGKSSIIQYIEQIFLKNNDEKEYLLLYFINNELKILSNKLIKKVNNNSKYINNIMGINRISLLTYFSEMPYPHENRKILHLNNSPDNFHTINMQTRNIYKSMAKLIQTKNTIILDKLKFIFTPNIMVVDVNNEYKNNLIEYIHNHLNEDLSFKNTLVNEFLENKIVPNKTTLIDKIINEVYENNGRYDDFLNKKAEEEFDSNKKFYKENWLEDGYSMSDNDIIDELSSQYVDTFPLEDFISSTFNKDEIYQWFLNELNLKIYDFFDGRVFGKAEKKSLASKLDIFKVFLFFNILKNKLLEKYLINIVENYFKFYSNIESISDLINKSFEDSEINKIEIFLQNNLLEFNLNYKFFKQLLSTDSNKMDYFNQYYDFFIFDFIDDKNRTFSSLSHGEKTFFGQIMNIYHYTLNSEHNDFLLCFDEPEISLHTKWQQIYLKNLIYTMKQINKQICLLFTSHSPFLLSDLPKENVIFLKDGEQVDVDMNPFGANIHTLLSHGFFMKDGLMGEFAKSKIEDLINYLNDKESDINTNDEAQKLLNIIGELVIKNQLQKMLDSKRLSKVDEVNKKIKDMEYDLKILKQNQSKYIQDELNNKGKRKYIQSKDDDK